MDWKKLGKSLIFPHIAIIIILVPIAAAFLIYSMVVLGTESWISIVSYVLAAYTLTVWCVRIPRLIKAVKSFKKENILMMACSRPPPPTTIIFISDLTRKADISCRVP